MTKLFLRAALVGCAAAAVESAQTSQVPPVPPVLVALPPALTEPIPLPPAPQPPAKMVLKTFDVADLVCPPADSPLAKPGTDTAMIAAAKAFIDVRSGEVLKAVRTATDRTTWDEYGGAGKLAVTTDGKTLVVNCPESTAEKIGECVKSLRTARHSHVKVDMTVFTVPSGNEAMVRLFGDKGTAAVSADEMNKVLRELKASGAVDILSRPTMVMMNKQTGFCQTGQVVQTPGCPATCETLGITTRVTPEVSADLKSILLAMELQQTAPNGGPLGGFSSQQSQSKLMMTDGGTMAVKVGTWKLERKVENKVPVVGDLPYIGRLFRNIGISTEPTDTVAVVTVTRVADAPCVVPPMMAPVPTIRTVRADGLERVGVNFDTLTTPATLLPTPTRGWVVEGQRLAVPANATLTWRAPAGVTFTRYLPTDVTLAGGVIGTTLNNDTCALMAAYKAACAAGRTDEATRLGGPATTGQRPHLLRQVTGGNAARPRRPVEGCPSASRRGRVVSQRPRFRTST